MARGKPKQLLSKKYPCALYCAAWPNGEYAIVAGGGGKKGTGIPNRVIVISTKGDAAGEEVSDSQTTEMPYRMALSPDSRVLLVAMQPCGMVWINIDASGGVPVLTQRTGDIASRLKGVGSIVCLCFSADGRLVALGREDGHVHIYEFPSFVQRASLWGDAQPRGEPKQVVFSAAHGNKLLSVVDDDGRCTLWQWEAPLQLLSLGVQEAGFKMGRFNRAYFGDAYDRRLYTTLNAGGRGYLAVWRQSHAGEIEFERTLCVSSEPLAAFEASPSGQLLALGTVEGDVYVYNSALKRIVQRKAQHTWVVTAMAWAQDSHAVLTVSGDASAMVTPARPPRRSSRHLLALVVMILVALLAIGVRLVQDGSLQLGPYTLRLPEL